jgi:hypothetical protein
MPYSVLRQRPKLWNENHEPIIVHSLDTASIANIRLALKVLTRRYSILEPAPTEDELQTLRSLVPDSQRMALDEVACELIRRETEKNRRAAGA